MPIFVACPLRAPRVASGMLVLAVLAPIACDPGAAPASKSGTRDTSKAPIVVSADPAAQKLDAGLAPAYKALKAGLWADARAKVAAYQRDKGASARSGQAEFVVAMTYHKQQLYGAAYEHFARALAAEPGFLETYYYAGSALFNLGRLAEARTALAFYAQHSPDDSNTAFQQGLVELEDDRIDDAERFFLRAITITEKQKSTAPDPRALDADLGRFHPRLGDVYVRRDDFARAKDMFTKATNLRGDLPDTWHKLELACERLGDAAGATRARGAYEKLVAQRAGGGNGPK